ncbi:YjzD family protein [Lactobacillus sp. DCY120]|uniref:YjzD family protein n=1 Tax=Bombilactobacillus apium TaxID=2675299 RepID=A0A850QVD3_9LACO|nr:YjzD family protein [Bombilactobacillus apium]NVY95744.1 YjzD family protein [Bombilactobacillus apium]
MKYLVTLFWTIVYGQILGYIGAALTSRSDQPGLALGVSVVVGLIICILPKLLQPQTSKKG